MQEHIELVPMLSSDVPVTYADTTPQEQDFGFKPNTRGQTMLSGLVALEQDFGFKPNTSLREGLRHFAEWYAKYYGV